MRKLAACAVLIAACTPVTNVTTTSNPITTVPKSTSTTSTSIATTVPIALYPRAEPDGTTLRLAVFDFADNEWSGPNLLPASLWRVHQPSGMIIPLLAADSEPSPAVLESDGWVVDVPLREGVTWSDGAPVASLDLAYTAYHNNWRAVVEPTSSGVALVFAESPGWTDLMTEVGLQPLLPAHYWSPLAEQGIEPGTSWEHDLAAPTAAGYRYVEHAEATVTLEAVLDWWDRGSTYETFNDGVRWINPVLGIDETYGSAAGERIGIQENGPHLSEVLYRQTEAYALISDVVGNEADLSLSPIGAGFWSGRETDTALPLLNKASSLVSFVFGEAATDPVIREAVACIVDVEFLRNNVLQGVARPFDLAGSESEAPCPGDDEGRLAEAVAILSEHGWTWDRSPTDPLLPAGKELPGLRDRSGQTLETTTIASVSWAVDPLRATTALWLENWSRGLGIPVQIMDPDGEPLSGARGPNLIEIPRFGTILQTEPSVFPGLGIARTIASAHTPWSEMAAYNVELIRATRDQASHDQAVVEFLQALLDQNAIIPLYRHSRQDIYNNWVVLPYTETTDGFESIEHVLEAIRIKR